VITNDSVITLANAGFNELFIFEWIHASRTRFDTTLEGLVALRRAGVGEDLIRVMAAHDVRAYSVAVEAAPAGSVEPAKVRME
jgi:hypothetical protein